MLWLFPKSLTAINQLLMKIQRLVEDLGLLLDSCSERSACFCFIQVCRCVTEPGQKHTTASHQLIQVKNYSITRHSVTSVNTVVFVLRVIQE